MRKRIFSSLLMVAFLFASVSVFTACKDYDDDINANKSDITALQSQLKVLQDALAAAENNLANAKSAADAAQTTADKALALASQAATQTEVDALRSTIEDVKALLNTKVDQSVFNEKVTEIAGKIDAINENLNVLTKGLADETEARIAAVADLQSQIDALNTFVALFKNLGLENEEDFKNFANVITGLVNGLEEAQKNITNNAQTIAEVKAAMEAAKSELQESISELADAIDLLNVLVGHKLTGLVFRPNFYYGGIEAMEATTIKYKAWKHKTIQPEKNPSENGDDVIQGTEELNMTPGVLAYYHVNPSYFDIEKIGEISFIGKHLDYLTPGSTRASNEFPVKGTIDAVNSKNGLLAVELDMDASKIADDADHVTVLALQATVTPDDPEKDDEYTVTSDYAALTKSVIDKIYIADNATDAKEEEEAGCTIEPEPQFHIYNSALQAIKADPTHMLAYNDEVGLNLSEIIEAHYKREGKDVESLMEKVSDYGLTWRIRNSHYSSGKNMTSESVHIVLVERDGQIYAVATLPTDDGLTPDEDGIRQNRATIGRQPMVRVELVYKEGTDAEKIVAIGFIKILINEEGETEQPKAEFEINIKPEADCEVGCDVFERKVSWYEIEHKVLAEFGITHAQFLDIYDVQLEADEICKLYEQNEDGEWEEVGKTQTVYYHEDKEDLQTSTLTWIVTSEDIFKATWNGESYDTDVNLQAWVKLEAKKGSGYPDIYVHFSTGIIKTPSATWGNANKNSNYWAAKNSNIGTGYDEIHNNVEVPGQTGAQCRFINDILSTLNNNNTVKLASFTETTSEDMKATDEFEFFFILGDYPVLRGQSGIDYDISVSADGKTLLAAKTNDTYTEPIAVLSGKVQNDETPARDIYKDNIITYQTTPYAKDILNNAGHLDLANSATATIGIRGWKCGNILPIEDGVFDVKFLRPIDVVGNEDKEFLDAVTGGNMLYFGELVTLSDWRDHQLKIPSKYNDFTVTVKDGKKIGDGLYQYYGVTKITVDPDKEITTDMDGGTLGETALNTVTSKIEFKAVEQTPSLTSGTIDEKSYGYLLYENNGQVVSNFTVRVPIVVEYKWGSVTGAYVDILIKGTEANTSEE